MARRTVRRVPGALARLIRRRREELGLSQRALAERAGLSAQVISALETGTIQLPHPLTLQALSQALELPLVELALAVYELPPTTLGTGSEPALQRIIAAYGRLATPAERQMLGQLVEIFVAGVTGRRRGHTEEDGAGERADPVSGHGAADTSLDAPPLGGPAAGAGDRAAGPAG